MNKTKFIEELKKINITLTNKQLEMLEKYYKILIEENNKYVDEWASWMRNRDTGP